MHSTRLFLVGVVVLATAHARPQDSAGTAVITVSAPFSKPAVLTLSSSVTGGGEIIPPGATYFSPTTTISLVTSDGSLVVPTTTANQTQNSSIASSASTTSSSSTTPISSTAAPAPSSTQPCNGYLEFCGRRYSNITEVCAHNSPFNIRGNLFSNQRLSVTAQLNDGIRMREYTRTLGDWKPGFEASGRKGQVHIRDGTLHFCHTKCDYIDAGPISDYLSDVTKWLKANPNEVVTILMGNGDNAPPTSYQEHIKKSGLDQFVYTPPKIPMGLNDWPTLSEMIASGKRAVIFLDYGANQASVPYILDQFSQLWETPFSPVNRDFPCNVDRPPGLNSEQGAGRMYIANHNLNAEIKMDKLDVLLPAVAELTITNGADGHQSLGDMRKTCLNQWNRSPNFLLVDYYDIGGGSVFRVAADANGVPYKKKCCTKVSAGSRPSASGPTMVALGMLVLAIVTLL
ncbi:MAG: hypothetical protein M1839_002839 [Geoglossum umbratile]|nr:MAG: hypothetical protein M1839_002839 [Geoglossum umbratile]